MLAGSSCIALAQTNLDQIPPDQLLLKDHQPRSIYNIPHTTVRKAHFPVIDAHSHPYARTPEEVDQWVRTMDELGIQKVVILTGATGQPFDQLVSLYGRYPKRFSLWCGFDYAGINQPDYAQRAIAELARCVKAGAEGVGELSDKGGGLVRDPRGQAIHLDDPRLAPLLDECANLGLPINIHVGDPEWMYQPMNRYNDGLMNALTWRLDNKTNILSHAEVLATLRRAIQNHPHTTFVACHFANCSYDLSILGRMLDRHPNLYADISARYGETATIPRYMAKFYQKYQHRLLYGTDMGFSKEMYLETFRILQTRDEHFYDWNFNYHWALSGFGLPDQVLQNVYEKNALTALHPVRQP